MYSLGKIVYLILKLLHVGQLGPQTFTKSKSLPQLILSGLTPSLSQAGQPRRLTTPPRHPSSYRKYPICPSFIWFTTAAGRAPPRPPAPSPRRVSPRGGAASSTEPCANGLIASHCLPLSLRLKLRELLPPQPPPASGSPTPVASMSVGPCVGSLHGPCAATFASPCAGGLHRTLLRGLHLVTATRVLLWHPALIRVCSSSNRWSCQQQVILV